LLSAIYGRVHEEKLRTQEQLTKKYELANKTAEGNLLDRAALMAGFSRLGDALVNVVMTDRNLIRESKEDFFAKSRLLAGYSGGGRCPESGAWFESSCMPRNESFDLASQVSSNSSSCSRL
jgi:hypothetical protein